MVRTINRHETDQGMTYAEFSGLSTDEKPVTTDLATGSVFLEVDTGAAFFYDEEGGDWVEVGG